MGAAVIYSIFSFIHRHVPHSTNNICHFSEFLFLLERGHPVRAHLLTLSHVLVTQKAEVHVLVTQRVEVHVFVTQKVEVHVLVTQRVEVHVLVTQKAEV